MGFTDLDKEGMLIEGFDQLGTYATNYNRPYYPKYLERLGYPKDIDWIEFRVKTPDAIPEKVQRVQELITKRTGVRLYDWKDKKDLVARYGHQLFELLDEAYKDLYGTCPLSEGADELYIKTYLGFVDRPLHEGPRRRGAELTSASAWPCPASRARRRRPAAGCFPSAWFISSSPSVTRR